MVRLGVKGWVIPYIDESPHKHLTLYLTHTCASHSYYMYAQVADWPLNSLDAAHLTSKNMALC